MPWTFLRRAQLLEAVCERLRRLGNRTASFQLASAHPELLSAVPALVGTLRREATPEQVPALTKLLERAIREAEVPVEFLRSELAKLCVRQSEGAAANQPARRGEVMSFLTQAHELEPDDFTVARSLAVALREQHQDARATGVLKQFLQDGALPTERAEARRILGLK